MAAVMRDTAKGNTRLVLGATERSPLVIVEPDDALFESGDRFRVDVIERALSAHGVIDPIGNQIRVAACQRALKKSFGVATR